MSTLTYLPDFQSPAEAVAWLVQMGADEIVLEQAVDRFAESAKSIPPAAKPVAAPTKPVATATPMADVSGLNSIAEIIIALNFLDNHPLKKSATKLSFFEGPERSRILLIADSPRKEEDRSGLVFADKARLLVANMLAAIGLKLDDVALMNLLPWRVLGGRAPNATEVLPSLPYVRRAVELLQPQAILAFSALPGQYLGGADASIQRQRGKWIDVSGIPLLATLHPEELLRTPTLKRQAWRDLQIFAEKLK
ncbi:MAG: uracil-DNA glycosylase [Pseudomonadota bacterium]|nr:uracil-DNA glycosylase [Pseudomonadota bacterium]